MAQFLQFDPVGNFQRAKANRLSLEAKQNDLALQPQRNELLQLQLEGQRNQNALNQQKIDIQKQSEGIRKSLGLMFEVKPFVQAGDTAGAIQVLDKHLKAGDINENEFRLGAQLLEPDAFQKFERGMLDKAQQLGVIKAQPQTKPSALESKLLAEGLTPGTPEYQARARELNSKSGVNVTTNVNPDGKQEPTKSTLNSIQKNMLGAEQSLRDLSRIADTHSDEFLTNYGRFKAFLGKAADGFNVDPFGLATFNAERAKFSGNVKQFFNQYRKEITGAAASVQELQQLVDALFSPELGPKEFKAKFDEFQKKVELNLQANRDSAREGIEVGGGKDQERAFDREYDPATGTFK